jgi:hypothetical protein
LEEFNITVVKDLPGVGQNLMDNEVSLTIYFHLRKRII